MFAPRADEAGHPETPGLVAPNGGRGLVALVVDDEPSARALVSAVLRRRGWSVLEASDAAGAMQLARTEALDLLVTDYEMPAITGDALADRLRERDANLPVLMISGRSDIAGRLRGARISFVQKPFPIEELIARIGALVG